METQGPIRFVVLCEKKKARQNFGAEKDNERNTAYSMEKPNKHAPSREKQYSKITTQVLFSVKEKLELYGAERGRASNRGLQWRKLYYTHGLELV
jgi:hypothetical protein